MNSGQRAAQGRYEIARSRNMSNEGFKPINIILIVTGVLALASGVYFGYYQSENKGVIEQPLPETVVEADEQVEGATMVEESTTTDQTAGWKTLTNVYAWSIQYPETWESYGHHDVIPENDNGPILTGPKGCYDNNLRCGFIQVDVGALRSDFKPPIFTSKQYLERYSITSDTKILGQRELIIGGYPAYEITKNETNWRGYPNGKISKSIAVKYQGGFVTISYYEGFKDKTVIKSSDDWELTSLFNKMLSTFKFIGPPATPVLR